LIFLSGGNDGLGAIYVYLPVECWVLKTGSWRSSVDDTRCTALRIKKRPLRKKWGYVRRGGYFFDSVGDLGLVADVTRVEWRVMMALDDVKYGHRITARDQSLHDMSTEETTATDDEESVALWGGHESREQEIYFEYRLTISRLNLRDHVTTWILRISNPNLRVLRTQRPMQRTKFSPEQKHQLLANLDIEGNVSLSHTLPYSSVTRCSQSHIVPANSNHGSQTPSPHSATATNFSWPKSLTSSAE
jgi:hypothetical protein